MFEYTWETASYIEWPFSCWILGMLPPLKSSESALLEVDAFEGFLSKKFLERKIA